MSYLEYTVKSVPTGARKLFFLNWPLIILIISVASIGFLMLYSVAGGSWTPWAQAQMRFMRLQPSELAKITLVMLMAAYYDWLPIEKTSKPQWVLLPLLFILIPVAMVLRQPDLGTALLLVMGGGIMMWLAGLHWAYFAFVIASGVGLITAVFQSRGADWQLLKDYQYRRIDTFLNPESDPLGTGYHLCVDHRLLCHFRLQQQRPLCVIGDPWGCRHVLPVLCREHVDGHGVGPCGWRAIALGQLWRVRHVGPAHRLWSRPKRPCP